MAAAGAAVSGRAASLAHLHRARNWRKGGVFGHAHTPLAARLSIFFKTPSLRHRLVHTLQPQTHHPLMQPRAQRTSSLLG